MPSPGVDCEVEVNECEDAPCQNGATCQDGIGSYTCRCPEPPPGADPWGGHRCDVPLVGCREHRCRHGAGCRPELGADGRQRYTCLCPPGRSGDLCHTSTGFSFGAAGGYVRVRLPSDRGAARGPAVRLRFRTTLPGGVLFYRGDAGLSISLELAGGRLRAALRSGEVLRVDHPLVLNDGEWHEASVEVEDGGLWLGVRGPGCDEEEGCAARGDLGRPLLLPPASLQQLYVGGEPEETPGHEADRGFVGCMEDLRVDGRLFSTEDLSGEDQRGMEPGCNRTARCPEEACSRRGSCVDLWVRADCDCHRPYYGDRCENGRG